MYAENASFIKSIEVDDSVFECDPKCDKSYVLHLKWDTQNNMWSWKVEMLDDFMSGIQSQIDALDERVSALE